MKWNPFKPFQAGNYGNYGKRNHLIDTRDTGDVYFSKTFCSVKKKTSKNGGAGLRPWLEIWCQEMNTQ